MHEISYRISEDDYVAAQRLYRRKCAKLHKLGMLVLVVIGLAMVLLGWRWHQWWLVAVGVIYAGIPWWWFELVGVRLVRRNYQRYPAIQDPQCLSVSDEAVRITTSVGESRLPWSKITQWTEDERMLQIYLQPKLFFLIPLHADPQGTVLAALRAKLQAEVGFPK